MISVIMSLYNEKLVWIEEAVNSILNQTYKEIEFLIIIDNPDIDKEIKSYIKELANNNSCVYLIWNKRNIGLAASLNKGIHFARGEYIARMDADDISDVTRLEKEIIYLKRHNFDMVATNKKNIDEDGYLISEDAPIKKDPNKILMYGNMIIHSSVLIKKEVLLDLNGYREFVNSEDWDLWLRIVERGYRIGILNKPLLLYRERRNSASIGRQLEQFYVSQYIIKLYKQRQKSGGFDSFSVKAMHEFLNGKKSSEKKKGRFAKAYSYIQYALDAKRKRKFIFCIFYIFLAGIKFPALVFRDVSWFLIVQSKKYETCR